MLKRRLDLWLPSYVLTAPARLAARLKRKRQLTHVMFLVCDHFEPRHGVKHDSQAQERVQSWARDYAAFQNTCRERFGTAPLHTWFYPPHHGSEHLSALTQMVFDGLGEVELHYHHDGDTSETLRRDLRDALDTYNRWGLLLESGEKPKRSFGFIHGDWALGNSCAGKYCGVNDELTILQELGCWGDFTMPSANQCQTRKINSIYYAEGDANRPKSHDWGRDSAVGTTNQPGMWLMQGPLGINWQAPGYPRVENASLTTENWGRPDRIRKWLDSNVHVQGKPDWLFIKLHTHGAIEKDFDALFGEKALAMHQMLHEQLNDGKQYQLHYVTARQAFNIAKAAEHGKSGSPADWLDYQIGPQPHSLYVLNAPHDLTSCTLDRLQIDNIEESTSVTLNTRVGASSRVAGPLKSVRIEVAKGLMQIELAKNSGEIVLKLHHDYRLVALEGGRVVAAPDVQADGNWRLAVDRRCQISVQHTGVVTAQVA
jgi:hypothetical protein